MSKKNALVEWKPETFEGTDILPCQPREEGLQLAKGEELVGDDNVELEDLVLPVLSILHGTSGAIAERKVKGAEVGKFHMTVTDDVFDPPLRVLFIHHSKGRSMFPKDADPRYAQLGRETCVSKDGVNGSKYGDCEECGLSEWNGKHGNPPMCAKSHNFVVLTNRGPAILRCRVTNYQTAKDWITDWKMSGVNMWHHPVIIRASTGQRQLAGGKIQSYPTIELGWQKRETVPPDVREQCHAEYEKVQAAWEQNRMRGEDEEID
jgi:hypothetical protein